MQETSTIKILSCIAGRKIEKHNCNPTPKTKMDTKIEINKRFGMPLFIPLIALIACFILSSRKDKKMFIYNKYIYSFASVLILALAEITVRYSGTSWNYTAIYYLIPFVMIPSMYFVLVQKFKYENFD